MVEDSDGALIIQKSERTRLKLVKSSANTFDFRDEELGDDGQWLVVGYVSVPQKNVCEAAACFAVHYDAGR